MGRWVYEDGKHRQVGFDAVAEEPEKWLIVRRAEETYQVYLRRRFNPWAPYEGWQKVNAPVMTFPSKADAETFVVGLMVTGQVEDGKYRFRRLA
jgi:hypothetical protein